MDASMFNFELGTPEEALAAAKQADYVGLNSITEPGAYSGVITKFCFTKSKGGAGGLNIAITTDEGKVCEITMWTMTKKGLSTYQDKNGVNQPLPAINQVRGSLMPCLMVKSLQGVVNGEEVTYPTMLGRQLGMLVDVDKTFGKTNGRVDPSKIYTNPSLKTFFCPKTNRVGSEILNKVVKPELKDKIIQTLKVIDHTIGVETAPVITPDPFSGGNTDPFGSPEENAPEIKNESKTEVEMPVNEPKPSDTKVETKEDKPVELNDQAEFWD